MVNTRAWEPVVLHKYVGIASSLHYPADWLGEVTTAVARDARQAGFEALLAEQQTAWRDKWKLYDVQICKDPVIQHEIRFRIFRLLQTHRAGDCGMMMPRNFAAEESGQSNPCGE